MPTPTKTPPRHCQPCTACCDGWLQMLIDGVEIYPGHPCPHSTKNGCDDYDHRPTDPCVNFKCGWAMPDSPLPDWMKPSNAKVIVIFDKLRWQGLPVDLAVPVGRRIPPRALKWLYEFARDNERLLLYTEQIKENGSFQKQQTVLAYGPPEFRQDILNCQREGRPIW